MRDYPKKSKKRKNKQPEYDLQVAVVNYLKLQYPNALYCASAGGIRTSISQAKKLKATGYVKGFPDLFIYESKQQFHGLAIELKVKGNYAKAHQKEWISNLEERGYMANVCTGFDQAKDLIDAYLNI
tara:strand:- start:9141 stop:9521 length:381 start_codon:yes stop_codon:yes gene_type:complete